ncbi:VOC family protein [Undibacterium fentianense]|uniref:VOC family protein n=1 Tax=Undibacterium fentianense TaxID=2828728 RepID=A0A941DZR9_9BURK|nr:VOC family protein [Undibacterium fentianense]MBR7800529.1 VOC family protein [Undibacterium fentianense]
MPQPNFILLYVDNPILSTHFYADLLNLHAIESSPTFSLFGLDSGLMLGLWSKHAALPRVQAAAGAHELAFAVANQQTVEEWAIDWQERGIVLIQAPCQMDFGFTFVGLDPDGHRLRVFAPGSHP